ncbi:hypothetical protein E2P81_ATG03171 [Venturia nashicola]|nr:hypothetical protein E2P81_ATG03171 [Venturia nashicola]
MPPAPPLPLLLLYLSGWLEPESALSSLVAALKAYKALRSLVDQALVLPTVAATTTTTYEAAVINFVIAGPVPGS